MCGHVGLITKALNGFTLREAEAMAALLYFDNFRGEDATSLTLVNYDGQAVVKKEATAAPTFIKNKEVEALLRLSTSRGTALLGHNRKATVGGLKDENAHPFVIDERYIFNHNGKLQNHVKYHQTEVDSEAFGKLLCPLSEDVEALGKQLSDVDASYVAIWYDAKTHKVYMIRNSERPLFWARTAQTMYYASETWMLEAVDRLYDLKLSKPEPFVVNRLYCWDLASTDPSTFTYKEVAVQKKATPPYTGGKQQSATTKESPTTKQTTTKANRKTPTNFGLMEGCSTFNNPYLQSIEYPDEFPLLNKSKYRRERNKIAQELIVAWVDDVIPDNFEAEKLSDTDKSYTAYCSTEEYPSWVFTKTVTAKSLQEAEDILEGKFISGFVTAFEFENGWGKAVFTTKARVNRPSISMKQQQTDVMH